MQTARPESRPVRLAGIDQLKLVCIVGVVMAHAMRPRSDPALTPLELGVSTLAELTVPGFLLCSGYLLSTRRQVAAEVTYRRLRRLLEPYLLASVLALVVRSTWGHATEPAQPMEPIKDLLTGNAFGIYYYVFQAAVLAFCVPWFSQLSPRALSLLAAGFFFSTSLRSYQELGPAMPYLFGGLALAALALSPQYPQRRALAVLSLVVASLWLAPWFSRSLGAGALPSWYMRHPILGWGYFLVGWQMRVWWPSPQALRWRWRTPLLALLVVAWALLLWLCLRTPVGEPVRAGWPMVWLGLMLLVLLLLPRQQALSAAARTLSTGVYTIYLFHLFFMLALGSLPGMQPWSPGRALLLATVGLAGPVLLILILRHAPHPLRRLFGVS